MAALSLSSGSDWPVGSIDHCETGNMRQAKLASKKVEQACPFPPCMNHNTVVFEMRNCGGC